ncbi:ankyrin repeat-containing domain protein [Phyllosticta capitalensis]
MTWWDDFANNLATDLGPLISLFGEEPTKQYLSETTLPEDVIIFAMAPIGILTALVSVIRVCGSPSLRAFIGRAQEGEGNAEVELQSSTSRNVGELYNNGGVARVYGTPKLLEIMFDPEASEEEFYHSDPGKATAGIHWPREYFNNSTKKSEWVKRIYASAGMLKIKPENPTTSKTLPRNQICPSTLASSSSGVLIWAGFSRYTFHFIQANSSADYAVPMTVAGTILVSCGTGLSALLIYKSTEERCFKRDKNLTKFQTQMYWIQPGNQTIGDQVFDSFAYTDNTHLLKYVTSWKKTRQDETRKRLMESLVWVSVGSTMFGFVLQFLGLRACHSSVSVAQLGAMLIMSMVRAGLRTRRLKESGNLMRCDPDAFAGHELDWLALRLGGSGESQQKWQIAYVGTDYSKSTTRRYHRNSVALCIDEEYQLVGFRKTKTAHEDGLQYQPEGWAREFRSTRVGIPQQSPVKTFFYRCRLAHMTGSWTDTLVPLRKTVSALADAINLTADYIFATLPENDEWAEKWTKSHTILWPIKCRFPIQSKCDESTTEAFIALKRLVNKDGDISSNWAVDIHELEAALGLQIWSLNEQEEEQYHRGNSGMRILWQLPRRSDLENPSLEYDMWRESRQPTVKEHDVYPPWSNEKSSSEIGARQNRVRSGWQNISDKRHNGTKIKVLALPTRLPLTKLYAQEIYSLFFSAIIRTTTEITPFNVQTRRKLEHGIVSRVQKIFSETKLGSPEDALTCIIPVLKLQKKTETVLHIAARGIEKEMKILEDLLDIQADSSAKPSSGESKRQPESLRKRQLDLLTQFLPAKKSDINSKGVDGLTPLLYAIDGGQFKIAQLLLNNGAKSDMPADCGTTPLSWAISILSVQEATNDNNKTQENDNNKTQDNDNNKTQDNDNNKTQDNDNNKTQENDNNETQEDENNETQEDENIDIINRLLGQNADPSVKNKRGYTPLHFAARVSNKKIILALQKRGVDFAARDEDGDTPLHWAAQDQHVKAMENLLKANPDPAIINSKNNDGKTPLHCAIDRATENNKLGTLEVLLNYKADPEIKDNSGKSPISIAQSTSEKKRKKWMKTLIEHRNKKWQGKKVIKEGHEEQKGQKDEEDGRSKGGDQEGGRVND